MIYSVDFLELAEKILTEKINPFFFAKHLEDAGWTQFQIKRDYVTVFQLHRGDDFFQVTIPMNKILRDYREAMYRAICVVAEAESKSVHQLMLYLLNPDADTSRVRMLSSNNRKLSLCGWLQKNNSSAYQSPLRLQKFLFFYESFSKVDGDVSDFRHLKGYKRGPVFSSVWRDYTKDRVEFDNKSLERYNIERDNINNLRAQRASFIVSSLSEGELSALIHQFNIWNAKRQRILAGEQQVELDQSDFGESDFAITKNLERMYPAEVVQGCGIVAVGEKFFIFSKKDIASLTEQHFDILASLSNQEELHNPVYAEIDEEGRLCVE